MDTFLHWPNGGASNQAAYLAAHVLLSLLPDIDIDRPGKDSYRLREAGCQDVLLLGAGRWALTHELRGGGEPPLSYLLSRLQHCDLVLMEGFKSGTFPPLR